MTDRTPQLFAAAYLSPRNRRRPVELTSLTAEFHDACTEDGFPYDIGDDPSFFASSRLGGPVTWGVCRTDVRGMIQPGDWMAFFSARRNQRDRGLTEYCFVAALRVERLTAHDRLSDSPEDSFSSYLNLLIRPSGMGWEHHEPALHPRDWHHDWMWRVARRPGFRKAALVAAGKAHEAGSPLRANGRPLPLAPNYVVFGKELAIRPPEPLRVATHTQGDRAERWREDPRVIAMRELIFGSSPRALRTTNRQQPHRHFRRPLAGSAPWSDSLRETVSGAI